MCGVEGSSWRSRRQPHNCHDFRGEFVQVPFRKQVYVGQEVFFTRKERISLWQVGAAAVLFLALWVHGTCLSGASFLEPTFRPS